MVRTIAIPSKGRVSMLRRALRKHVGTAPEDVDFLVIDGSEKAEDRNETKAAIRQIERECRRKIRYASHRELDVFASLLGKRGIAEEAFKSAVTGGTGAARNVALLDTLGQKIVLVDDDVTPFLYRHSAPSTAVIRNRRGTEIASDPSVFWFYPSRSELFVDEALQKSERFEEELFASLGESVERTWGRMRSDGLLVRGDRFTGRVAAVAMGVAGDPAGLRFQAYPTIKDALSKANYRDSGYVNRAILRMPVEETLQKGTFLQVHAVALDNSRTLPPFAPFESTGGLGGGSTYGRFLSAISDAYVLHRPWAVQHDPPDTPTYDPHEVYKVRSRDLAILAVEACSSLEAMGEELSRLAALPSREFTRWAKDTVKDHANRLSSELSVRISDSSLLEVYDTSKAMLEGVGHQEDLRQLATVLRVWPDLVKVAIDLQEEEGIRISTEL